MQLTTHTDYALRTLIMLALEAPHKVTTAEIGQAYGISEHHLVKVIGKLTSLGYVTTTRGKDGGVQLAVAPELIVLGQVVREVEAELGVVACLRSGDKPCAITPACRLQAMFQEATEQFLRSLSQYRLSDVLAGESELRRLLQLGGRRRPETPDARRGDAHPEDTHRDPPS